MQKLIRPSRNPEKPIIKEAFNDRIIGHFYPVDNWRRLWETDTKSHHKQKQMAIIRAGDNERTPQGDKSVGVTETTPMAPKKALAKPLIPKFRRGGSSQIMEKAKEVDGRYAREVEEFENLEVEDFYEEEGESRSRTLGSRSTGQSVGNEELLEVVMAQGETIKRLERQLEGMNRANQVPVQNEQAEVQMRENVRTRPRIRGGRRPMPQVRRQAHVAQEARGKDRKSVV